MLTIRTFALNDEVLAKRVYRDYPHQTTPVGLVMQEPMRRELTSFLGAFLDFIGCPENLFLRLDVFIKDDVLNVIEINVELQDGWGVALNLLRASGNKPRPINGTALPTEIIAYSDDYLPEFEHPKSQLALKRPAKQNVGWRERQSVSSKSR